MKIEVIPNTELATKVQAVTKAYQEEFPFASVNLSQQIPFCSGLGLITIEFQHEPYSPFSKYLLIKFSSSKKTVYFDFWGVHIPFPNDDLVIFEGVCYWMNNRSAITWFNEFPLLPLDKDAPKFERIGLKVYKIFEGYRLHPEFVL